MLEKTFTHEEEELFGFALRHELRGQVNAQSSVRGSRGASGDVNLPGERPRRGTAGSRLPGCLREQACQQFIIRNVQPEVRV